MGGCVACLGSGNVQGDTAEVVTTALYWLSNILRSFHVYNDFFYLRLLVLNSSFLFFYFHNTSNITEISVHKVQFLSALTFLCF